MALAAGTRVGPYEVRAAIGAGGMGEVYRAQDTKLRREVALKLLPPAFATDAERLARFEREAQILASFNHPNIGAIYGFEESLGRDGYTTRALVLELVEGPTLAERIARGPIPPDEALRIARQIAEALEAAHAHGIVHRDLKPANIKVREDGTVKVLDFGLAKLATPPDGERPDATATPTRTSEALATGAGVILGSAAYMSPEQARGSDVDQRTDVWAFGCVLFEMLTGRRAFIADTVTDTLALVLTQEPDWRALPAATPPAIRAILRRCLVSDRRRRLADMGVALLEIDDVLAAPAPIEVPASAASRTRHRLAWGAAVVAGIVAVGVTGLYFADRPPAPPRSSIRFHVLPPPGNTTAREAFAHSLSPDGRWIVFRHAPLGMPLAIRAFDQEDARPLPGTETARGVFWSHDSRFIAFFSSGTLQVIDLAGGSRRVVCDVTEPAGYSAPSGTWNADGIIVFGMGGQSSGLLRVSDRGGTPVPVTTPDAVRNELWHRHPSFLPGGRRFLYVASSVAGRADPVNSVHVGSIDGEPPETVLPTDSQASYADGFLLFVRNSTLHAQAFDADRRATTADPVVVAQDMPVSRAETYAPFSVSAGLLSYRSGSTSQMSRLEWRSRGGDVLGVLTDPADQAALRLSPDGTRVAISVLDPSRRSRDIWVQDLTRGLRSRMTSDPADEWSPAWSPDGRSLVFSGSRLGPLDVYRMPADQSGAEGLLLKGPANKYVLSWSPDGRQILYEPGRTGSDTGSDLWLLPLDGPGNPQPFLRGAFDESGADFSPDGRWVAYESNETGRYEIFVTTFPGAGTRQRISTGGGRQPRWQRDGREIFFQSGPALMAADVNSAGDTFQVGAVRRLFEARFRTQSHGGFGVGSVYDVMPDGQRFIVNVVDEEPAPPAITIVTNWTAALQ